MRLAEAQIVDVMGVVRKIKTTGFNNFGDLAREFYKLTEYYDVTYDVCMTYLISIPHNHLKIPSD